MASENKSGSKGNSPMDQDQTADELKRNNEQAGKVNKEKNEDTEFPGYPHYPAKDDIMTAAKDGRVDVDVENLPKRGSTAGVDLTDDMPAKSGSAKDEPASVADMDDDEIEIVPGTEADVTKEDLEILDSDNDTSDSLNRVKLDPIDDELDEDETGEDLDVPGSELDDENESLGEEDEENNYYSLGGDSHENLEEDKS